MGDKLLNYVSPSETEKLPLGFTIMKDSIKIIIAEAIVGVLGIGAYLFMTFIIG